MPDTWDVIVIGAGPAGALGAYVLADKGRQVLVMDRARTSRRGIGESLPGAARRILRDVGLLHLVTGGAHATSAGTAFAWEHTSLDVTDAMQNPDGLGWHLDRARFDADLRQATEDAGALFRVGHVRRVEETGAGWQVQWADGAAQARWVVDASGRAAVVGRSVGAERLMGPPLVALVRWTEPGSAPPGEQRTTVEAVRDGWWYTAPLPDESRIVALHVRPERAQEILRSGIWRERLAETTHIHALVSGATWEAPPRGTDAGGAWTEAPGGDRTNGAGWLAVGDAAMSFDPIASQGLFNALYTGYRGAQTVHAALAGHEDGVGEYVRELRQVHMAYLRRWRETYARPRRWPGHTFWAERQQAEKAAP